MQRLYVLQRSCNVLQRSCSTCSMWQSLLNGLTRSLCILTSMETAMCLPKACACVWLVFAAAGGVVAEPRNHI